MERYIFTKFKVEVKYTHVLEKKRMGRKQTQEVQLKRTDLLKKYF